MPSLLSFAWLLAAGCAGKREPPDETGAETGGEGGEGDEGGEGLSDGAGTLSRAGEATVSETSYAGTEDLLVTEAGTGAVLCRVRVSLATAGTRADCLDCAWAWDLVASDATVVAESGVGCAGAVGLDAAAVAAMNGESRAYGVNPDYFGHAAVLLVEGARGWNVVAFIEWDEETASFTYAWDEGDISW